MSSVIKGLKRIVMEPCEQNIWRTAWARIMIYFSPFISRKRGITLQQVRPRFCFTWVWLVFWHACSISHFTICIFMLVPYPIFMIQSLTVLDHMQAKWSDGRTGPNQWKLLIESGVGRERPQQLFHDQLPQKLCLSAGIWTCEEPWIEVIWARSCENVSYAICKQQRSRIWSAPLLFIA